VVYERILNHYPTTADGIAQAIADLNEAIGKLVLNTDKAGLQAELLISNAITNAALYTTSSWSLFMQRRSAANEVNNDPNATQPQIDTARLNLFNARTALALRGNNTALTALINANTGRNSENYTSNSWSAFSSALSAAQNALNNHDLDQAQVDAIVASLQNAINGLVSLVQLRDLVAQAQAAIANPENYTSASFTAANLAGVLSSTNAVWWTQRANNATQAQVSDAVTQLTDALAKLALVGNQDALLHALNVLYAANENDYTTSSWHNSQYAAKRAAAEALRPPATPTPAQIAAAIDELRIAFEALVLRGCVIEINARANAIINEIAGKQARHSANSWNQLQIMLSNAGNGDLDNANLSQAQVDELLGELNVIYGDLVYIGALLDAIAASTPVSDMELYTPESWAPYQHALEQALITAANPWADREEVENARLGLIDANAGLVPATGDVTIEAVTGRRLTAGQAGDGSEWIEIARTSDGKHSLILRVTALTPDSAFGPNNDYANINNAARERINAWFNGLAGTIPIRATAVDNDVMSKIGSRGNITDANGFSRPFDTKGQNSDIAFLLSYQEAARYASTQWWNSGTNTWVSHPTGSVPRRNWQALGAAANAHWWLRSPGFPTNIAAGVGNLGNVTYSNLVSSARALRPAIWVESSIFGSAITTPPGEIFTDSTGVAWRVLRRDAGGDTLITTEHVYGARIAYHSVNQYVHLHNSNVLRPALNTWYNNTLAPELKAMARPADNLQNDVRSAPGGNWQNENGEAGWTRAGTGAATAANAMFVLSTSEVNRYHSAGTLNVVADGADGTKYADWWTRSPGATTAAPNTFVNSGGGPTAVSALGSSSFFIGFRPTIWVNAGSDVTTTPEGETFTDSTGIVWRVLSEDDKGNKYIITEHVHGVGTQYTSHNNGGIQLWNTGVLRPALNAWYNNTLAPELKAIALPSDNYMMDFRGTRSPNWQAVNDPSGWTKAEAGIAVARNAMHTVSISEIHRYANAINLIATQPDGTPASWWTRSLVSSQSGFNASTLLRTDGSMMNSDPRATDHGFRPTMWVNAGGYQPKNNVQETAVGDIFIASNDVLWRVLAEDSSGNKLITTQYVLEPGPYHSENTYVRLQLSHSLRPRLNNWYNDMLAPELKSIALPAANLDNDVRSAPSTNFNDGFRNENAPAGWTSAGAGAATVSNALFVLSVSEFNRYIAAGTLNRDANTPQGTMQYWWLRSPGVVNNVDLDTPVAILGLFTSPTVTSATDARIGMRPTLWVNASSGAQPKAATSGRTATFAGDNSPWLEIATLGNYSLILRTTVLADQNTQYGADIYEGSVVQAVVNDWFEALPATSPLRTNAMVSDAMAKTVAPSPHVNPGGISMPSGNAPPTGSSPSAVEGRRNTAFLLSVQEAFAFCSVSYVTNNQSSQEARDNFARINRGTTSWWLRTTQGSGAGATASDVTQNGTILPNATIPASPNHNMFGVRPAIWVNSSIFN